MTDYFTRRQPSSGTPRVTRPAPQALQESNRTPGSPRTPLLGRSISSQFGASPGSFRAEQEDYLVYSIGARHFSAGFAGETAPRCMLDFGPKQGRRVGDYRRFEPGYAGQKRRKEKQARGKGWGEECSLYTADVGALDLRLVEARFDRALRQTHSEYLLLSETRPRKVVLAVPALLPDAVLEAVLRVLFRHQPQPPTVMLLPNPILACVSAGVRSGLVIDIGWEETVITSVYEYRSVQSRSTVRASKMLSEHMAAVIDEEVAKERHLFSSGNEHESVSYEEAEGIVSRMAWCKDRASAQEADNPNSGDSSIHVLLSEASLPIDLTIPFARFSSSAETAFFAVSDSPNTLDDHELPLHLLAYRALLSLPLDVRAVCVSRIILTGGGANLPGLQRRLLQEVQHLISTRRWDPIRSYGSATAKHDAVLKERSANVATRSKSRGSAASEVKVQSDDAPNIPAAFAPHDDLTDPIGAKAEREQAKGRVVVGVAKGQVRGVKSLGAWAGASLIGGMRIKGVVEVEKDDFMRHGFKDGARLL